MKEDGTSGRLRVRVTLYFLLTALPAALVSAGAVVVLNRLISQEIKVRTQEIVGQVRQEVHEEGQRIQKSLLELSKIEDVRQLAAAVADVRSVEQAEGLASARAGAFKLELLGIVAAQGPYAKEIVSSAHLPDSIGDPGPAFLEEPDGLGIGHIWVEGNPPKKVPALLSIQPILGPSGRPELLLYGGTRLDGARLGGLARMAGATMVLSSPPLTPQTFFPRGAESSGPKNQGLSIPLKELPGAAEGKSQIRVVVHTPRLEAARTTFFRLAIILVVGSLLAALVWGTLLSNRITRPILALSAGARQVGQGNLEVQIDPSSNDEVGALVQVFNNMTQELRESRQRLARAERIAAWQEIARRVAHEIKNPLFPIRMSMETLKKSFQKKHPKLEEIVEESTKTVLEEVGALNRIVTEFSNFARLPAPRKEPARVAELLKHAHRLYRESGVQLKEAGLDDLGSVAVDRGQIHQALINLVKNGIEAGPTVILSAELWPQDEQPGVRLSVADQGPGIPEEALDKLFTPYFTTKASGTGLGLAIVDRIVSEHGGTVDVESTPGTGSTFHIWLPQNLV